MRSSTFFRASAAVLAAALAGCGGDGDSTSTGGGGSGGTAGTGGDTGGGGAGGTGGGGACTPGETQGCYTGPAGTEGVGFCKPGTQMCKANGEGFGECTGDVTPVTETCATPGDDDCDGQVNEDGDGCACTPGDMMPCYSGPMGTLGVGVCQGGTQACKPDATGYGPCEGELTPSPETCLTLEDDDCDGQINEDGEGCVCVPGSTMPCYTGPSGTEGTGICLGGAAFCDADGAAWGPCLGEVKPQVETCLTAEDDDCDGIVNEEGPGCLCAPGSMVPCYTGPSGTAGVGLCKGGVAPCNEQGTGIGACAGEVLPQVETCLTAGDDDCDGQVNEDGEGCSCTPGATKPCYSGPAGTEGIGACLAGTQACLPDGSGYGVCTGEVLPSPENCQTAANEDCSTGPECGAALWSKKLGAASDQQANAIARDAQGNSIVAGRFAGTFTFAGNPLASAGGYDVFVAKLDPTGAALWAHRFGDAAIYQEATDVATDAQGNIFLTGYFEGTITFGATALTSAGATDTFLVKLSPSGNVLWAKRFGAAAAQYGQSLGVGPNGNVALLADGFGSMDFGGGALVSAGNYDMFVATFDPSGTHLWSKRFGGPNADVGQSLTVDAAGNVLFTGKSDTPLDFGGGALPAAGGQDALVVKLDPLGSFIWDRRLGDSANQFGADIAADIQNDVFLTGGFEGSIDLGGGPLTAAGPIDLYLGKLTSTGTHVWSKRFGSATANPAALGLAAGVFGDLFLVGQTDGTLDFGGGPLPPGGGVDAFVVRLDPTGAHTWSKRFGTAGNQYASGAAVDGFGHLLLTGYFEQTIDFGAGPLTSSGGLDTFVTKLAP